MRHLSLAIAVAVAPVIAQAETPNAVISEVVNDHILTRLETLAATTQILSATAAQQCDPSSESLKSDYGRAFDAWVSVSHLRFGPTEVDDRAFALAFWPDSRGATPRALSTLLSGQDPIATSVTDYAQVSIAARGFYALEFLLYDDALMSAGTPAYHCQLVQTISADIAQTSQDILVDWQVEYAATIQTPSPTGVYQSEDEALQEMFKALSTGLQFTAEARLGRPLGTFDRPRATRAEARRSGRSSAHVTLSLTSLKDLALRLVGNDADLSSKLALSFDRALAQLSNLEDPTFASVSVPQTRIKVEALQQSVETIRTIVRDELGPKLGVAAGFNSLDGD